MKQNKKNYRSLLLFLTLCFLCMGLARWLEVQPETAISLASASQKKTLQQIPTEGVNPYFIQNQGQLPKEVLYYFLGKDHSLYFLKDRVLVRTVREMTCEASHETLWGRMACTWEKKQPQLMPDQKLPRKVRDIAYNQFFEKSQKKVHIEGHGPLETKFNYIIGKQSQKHQSNIPTYREVYYTNLWNGIDARWYFKNRKIEYDFIVHPGANPKHISVLYDGAQLIKNKDGSITITTALGQVDHQSPYVYQQEETNGFFRQVEARFEMQRTIDDQSRVQLALASYDTSKKLVIDPLTSLEASTFIGGNAEDRGYSIKVSPVNGFVYVTGYTSNGTTDIPVTAGAYDELISGTKDVFVAKFDSSLSTLVAATFFGGAGVEYASDLDFNSSGQVYVTGYAYNLMPTTAGVYDTTFNGGSYDVFVARFDADLSSTNFISTYVGGSSDDKAYTIAIAPDDSVYVAGGSVSTDYPTASGYDLTHNGGWDCFVTKLPSDLSATGFRSTYLGGSSGEQIYGMALNSTGTYVYVTGYTGDGVTDLPTTGGAYDSTQNGSTDSFISRFPADLSGTGFASTFLGGSGGDYGKAIVVSSNGSVYATGYTMDDTTDMPTTAGAYNETQNGNADVYVVKLPEDLSGTGFVSTLIGGSAADYGYAIALDSSDLVYVGGSTGAGSPNFPTDGYDTSHNGGTDGFISIFTSDLTSKVVSTFLGGGSSDSVESISISPSDGRPYVTGYTANDGVNGFPTTAGAYDQTHNGANGDYDVFVSMFESPNAAPSAPTTLYSNNSANTAQAGSNNPVDLVDITPVFSAVYTDDDAGDIANKYCIEVNTNNTFNGTTMWQSTCTDYASSTAIANITAGNRSSDITYAGNALSVDTTYYWRIKFWDDDQTEGTWSSAASFYVTDLAPVLGAIGNKTGTETDTITFTATSTEPNTEDASGTYSCANANAAATTKNVCQYFTAGTGAFSWASGYEDSGSYNITITVADASNGSLTDSETITIALSNNNRAPVLTSPGNKTVAENSLLSFTLPGSDSDSQDTISFSCTTNCPTGLSVNASTGAVTWTPSYSQAGTYAGVVFSVTDGTLSATQTISITVTNTNRAPELSSIGNKSVNENKTLSVTLSGTDADGESLTYSASNLPTGASFTASTKTFTWKPSYEQSGSHQVTFSVSDGSLSDSETITITVNDISTNAPVAVITGPTTVTAGSRVSYSANSSSDAGGRDLTYTWSAGGASIAQGETSSTVVIQTSTSVDSFSVTLTVDNGEKTGSSSRTVTIKRATISTEDADSATRYTQEIKSVTSSGTIITQTQEEALDRGNVTSLSLPNNVTFYGLSTDPLEVITHENIVYIADPHANENQGKVWRVNTSQCPKKVYGWLSGLTGVISQEGESDNAKFGYAMKLFDLSTQGKLAILAPGEGVIYIYTDDLGSLMSVIAESDTLTFDESVFIVTKDITGDGYAEVIVGTKGTSGATSNINALMKEAITETGQLYVITGDESLPANMSVSDDADVSITGDGNFTASDVGDVNGDGVNDLVVTSLSECKAYLFYGSDSLSSNLNTEDADVIITGSSCDGTFGTNVQVGDVTGDGYAELIFGEPSGGTNGEGTILVMYGSEDIPESVDLSEEGSHLRVNGSYASGQLGNSILLADVDGDGTLDVVASETTDSGTTTVVLNLASAATATGGSDGGAEATNDFGVGGASGCSLRIDQGPGTSDQGLFGMFILMCLGIWAVRLRYSRHSN